MEKGALLPLRFYPATSWQDYQKIKNYSGSPGIAYLKEHHLYFPAFQMTMPDAGAHWGTLDFTTIDIVNVDTGTTIDALTRFNKAPSVYTKSGDFRSLVNFRFPYIKATDYTGMYYYHVSDGQTDWYSETFEWCDLSLNAIGAKFDNEAGWAVFDNNYSDVRERAIVDFCKTATGAGDATGYLDITTFLGEEFDLYVQTADYDSVVCGATDWNAAVYFQLRDDTGLAASEIFTVDTTDTSYTFTMTATIGGNLRLYIWMGDADTGKGQVGVWLQRRYAQGNIQIRYKNIDKETGNGKNTCKIFYEDDYENVFFIDSKQVIDQNSIEENVVEDDLANKYRIVGANQKWNSVQFASGEAMLNAMSLLRLHNEIKIVRETGEVMDVVEVLLEQSILDYEASLIKLVYREDSCAVESCGFKSCCPTQDTPIMEEVVINVGGLPACAAGTNGDYALVRSAAQEFQMYFCNGAAWALNATYDIADNCIEARQNNAVLYVGIRFFWFDTGGGLNRWHPFIYLAAVNDNADGTADLVTDTRYRDGLTIRGEYQDADGVWHECTDPVDLVAGGGAITLVTYSSIPGVGQWDFRFHMWTTDCDYEYSNVVTQTIT